ncbi:unnamed protein product [Clonostachys chloroleuca]|uniref:Uncharacterized protein n=1 Tax=Clonostachys chloroleuca TaxID=1926264 RepID=A0AA35M222_9HYPO|nr:unnamed protein product [Clonostachys chloroleuca]
MKLGIGNQPRDQPKCGVALQVQATSMHGGFGAKPLKTKLDKIVVGSSVGGFFGLLFLIMVIGLLWGRHISRRNAHKDARIEEAGLSGNHKSSAEGRIPLMTRSQSPEPEEPKPTYTPFTTLMSSTVGVLDRLHGEPKKSGGR